MNNLDIYEASRAVPKEAQKSFNNGRFSGTDINPVWRIKKLTELFGACGVGWYYEIISERAEQHGNVTIAVVDLNLYIKVDGEWSKPIYGTGGNTIVTAKGAVSDEGYKMALTDALSVACKALGIGADIYFDKDKTKYTSTTAHSPTVAKSATAQTPPPLPKQEEPPKEMDITAMRNRLNKITYALAQGKPENIATAVSIWTKDIFVRLEDIPDESIADVLNLAEKAYRKRGFTD